MNIGWKIWSNLDTYLISPTSIKDEYNEDKIKNISIWEDFLYIIYDNWKIKHIGNNN